MRAKFKIESVTRTEYGQEVLKFRAVCKPGGYPPDGLDEDNTFSKFSPSGELQITVANPALLGKFNPGEAYYLDFSIAPSS